jgi:hypothetical protein
VNPSNLTQEWERTVLLELQREHARICKDRKIFLRPLLLRIEEIEGAWARYDSWTRTLCFSRKLIQQHSWFQVLGVLRHQMAHQYLHENSFAQLKESGFEKKSWDEKFRAACRRLGVPPQFAKLGGRLAHQDLDWRNEKQNAETERILERIRKLLSLAQSTSEHEALLAMNRVREIYARHNLERLSNRSKDEFVHWVISTGKKRFDAWELKVLSILIAFFFVRVLTLEQFEAQTGEKKQAFELIGTRENVLMAEYVYRFLCQQIEQILAQNPKLRGRKLSRLEKNSYRLGILDGFAKKLSSTLRPAAPTAVEAKALMVVQALTQFQKDPLLAEYLSDMYPHLGRRFPSAATIDAKAFEAGHKAGGEITLHKPLNERAGGFGGLLSHSLKT